MLYSAVKKPILLLRAKNLLTPLLANVLTSIFALQAQDLGIGRLTLRARSASSSSSK